MAVLLTKADLVSEQELAEVVELYRRAARAQFFRSAAGLPVFHEAGVRAIPRRRWKPSWWAEHWSGCADEREAILARKLDTLLRECGDYLALSLKSAEMVEVGAPGCCNGR